MSTYLPSSSSTALQVQEGRRRLNSNDFISQMPIEILVIILSLLSIKEAAVTSILSRRWRFVWCNVTRLKFYSTQTLDMVEPDEKLYVLERFKYINNVNSVIRSYKHPCVQDFKIRFSLTNQQKGVIDEWLRFAVNKKVDNLELDLTDNRINLCVYPRKYDFPHMEIASLKRLVLKTVYVKESVLREFLTNCPHLETIVIHEPLYLNHIRIGGRSLSLKHFEIVAHSCVQSIYLTDFDLVSFTYKGCSVDLYMSHLPKLKEVKLYQEWGRSMSYHNLFHQISSCALSLEALSFYMHPMEYIKLDSIPELPNVKKLRLEIGGSKSKCLQELALILNACPNLETLTIVPFWTSPIINKKKARDLTNAHQRLKFVEILGYYGRNCDFELSAYLIHTCVGLKKLVIDTCWTSLRIPLITVNNYLKNKEAVVSSAKSKLESILPSGSELCML